MTADYFSDVEIPGADFETRHRHEALMYNIPKNYSDELLKNSSKFHIAILGIPEDRNSQNIGSAQAPDKIREKLYALYKPFDNIRVIDLGNIRQGKTVKDTYFAVNEVVSDLLAAGIVPVILGGTQDLVYPVFQAYEKRQNAYNFVSVDARFDLDESDNQLDSNSVLSKIVGEKPKFLFNYTNLAYQTYYTPEDDRKLMSDMYFDTLRLGSLRENIALAEPQIRDADFVNIDMSVIQMNDAPGHYRPSIHGLYGEEACQIAKYAGMSDKLSAFGIFETNPEYDNRDQTAELAAQLVWHFIQGYYLRQKDYPIAKLKQYRQFIVALESPEDNITFYQSRRTGRWWIAVPYKIKKKKHQLIVACSHEAYMQAEQNEIPDIWWKYYRKLN